MKKIYGEFQDKAIYDSGKKTAISVRDGILQYHGAEIGREPSHKIFKIYRSPATIANAAALMNGIKLTNEHVSLDAPPANPQGEVLSSKMIDLNLKDLNSRIGVLNTLDTNEEIRAHLDAGKRELSLGYHAALIDAPDGANYDLEQIDIVPHHLAVVNSGRCGSVCSFVDHKRFEEKENEPMTVKLKHKAFLDADGNPSLIDIVQIMQELPEAIKALPLDEIKKVMPTLQGIVKTAGGAAALDEPGDPDKEAEGEEEIKDPAEQPEQKPNEEGKQKMTPEEQKAADEAKAAEAAKKEAEPKVPVTDSKEFKDALEAATKSAVNRQIEVMDKARTFLDASYVFADKSTEQIMRDALAVEHGTQKFADNELDIAFKMLKKRPSQHRNFGDGVTTNQKFVDKEIE